MSSRPTDPAKTICFYCADQNPHRDKSRGITNYTYGLLANLQKSGQVGVSAVVSKSSSGVPEGILRFAIPFATDHIAGRLLADHLHPLIVPRRAGYIWHYPKGFLPLAFQVKAKKVGTIADTILQFYADRYPRSRSRLAFAYWLGILKHSIEKFDLIITVSECSRQAILEFCLRHDLRCPPVIVTYEDANISRPTTGLPAQKGDYVIHLASRLPHKKTKWLLEQWLKLQNRGWDLPTLRLVGMVEPNITLSKLRNVRVYPVLSDSEYESMLGAALAVILPSEIEGFGLPALEAYYLGTPVAYVRNTAVEEVLGTDTPGGFSLEDDSLEDAVLAVLEMDRASIDAKAAELRNRFSWARSVELTLAAYRSLS